MFVIPTANDLVTFIKDFTGSTNDEEIKKCIFMAELSMRNIELPALRCDPYDPVNIGVADLNGRIAIPGDMNKPILFFKQGRQVQTSASATGTTAQYTITLTSIPSQTLQNGMLVSGVGIATGAVISNITGAGGIGTIVTLNKANTGTVNSTLIFSTTSNSSSQTGPWIVYDRIGDRDIITQSMIAQLYLQPVNVPAVIRGKFSEVGDKYEFLPYVAAGDLINMYYYKAWSLLFSPIDDILVDSLGTVSDISGSGPWTATLTVSETVGIEPGMELTATDDGGSIGTGGRYFVVSTTPTTITFSATGGTTPVAGTVAGIYVINQTLQSNQVLNTWPEGYVYSTLREYYIKRHNDTDAAVYDAKYKEAWNVVEDQNNLGKWSGGHTRLTSVWQPRQYRQYNIK